MTLQLRRGTEATRTSITPASGEPIWTTDTFTLYVGDGSTPGGRAVSSDPVGGGNAQTSDPLSQFASTTSAQLAGVISDETGTGPLVFGTSPTLTTPNLGTPSALDGTNISGTASGLIAGNVVDGAITLTKQANVATSTVFYRKTAGTGSPEVQTLATLKTDLGLTGTNTGDQDLSSYATQAYANALVVGLLDDRGNYSASGNVYPSSGGSGTAGAILKGDLWTVSVSGTLGGTAVTAGDVVRALVDTPGQTPSNWAIGENNFGYVALNQAMASGTIYVGNGSGIGTAVTPSGDWTINSSGVVTLTTVNSNVGSFGSATQTTTFTVDAKGRITVAGQSTVTPAIDSITGLGTGVITALAIAVGTSGSVLVMNGNIGTPSAGILTNCTELPPAGQTTAGRTFRICGFGCDGGGAALTPQTLATSITVPVDMTLTAWNAQCSTGTFTVKFWKIATGTAIPTSANSINTSGVGVSTGTAIRSTSLSDFTTTAFTAGDIIICELTACSEATWISIELNGTKN